MLSAVLCLLECFAPKEKQLSENRENFRLGNENVFIRLLMSLGPVAQANLCNIWNYYTSWRLEQKSRQAGCASTSI